MLYGRYAELEDMTRCQMAMESISAAENLTVTEAEFDQEYQSAVTEFGDQKAEYDDAKLREQVTETLKVCSLSRLIWYLLCAVSLGLS